MNRQTTVYFNRSSFISLQAELARKKEQVGKDQPTLSRGKLKLEIKPHIRERIHINKNVEVKTEDPAQRDGRSIDDSVRDSLLIKSKIYDQLRGQQHPYSETDSLVMFDSQVRRTTENTDEEKDEEEEEECEADTEWVTFVDSLGRTRTCLRADVPYYKTLDSKLRMDESSSQEPKEDQNPKIISEELLLWDQKREELRKMWEEEENRLSQKRDIHYSDILFNEARMHGVGFFNFSQNETERREQQETLRKAREETTKNQDFAARLKVRREELMKRRIIAARKRKRQRMGLSDMEETDQYCTLRVENEPEIAADKDKSDPDQEFGKKLDEFLKNMKRSTHVRPWDIGKGGTLPTLSQHEWNDKLRAERLTEFAPPTVYQECMNEKNERKSFKKSRERQLINIDSVYDVVDAEERILGTDTREKRTEVPPPVIYDRCTKTKNSTKCSMEESIEAGLNFLKSKKN